MLTQQERKRRILARARVKKGTDLLDRHMPGWYKKIDLHNLRLRSCASCVCGQLAFESGSKLLKGFPRSKKGTMRFDPATLRNPYNAFRDYLMERAKIKDSVDGDRFASSHGFLVLYDEGQILWSDVENEWKRVIRRKLREDAKETA
jgi:hypothetical protein